MGVALETTCIPSYSQRRLRYSAVLAINIAVKGVANAQCTLLIRRGTLVLKMGVLYGFVPLLKGFIDNIY